MTQDAYYVPLGGGRYRPTAHTEGPWGPESQHAGPPSALMARELEAAASREEMVWARMTFELLGPVPLDELELEAAVTRPGRSVEMVEAAMRAGGREVMRARAWRVLGAVGPAHPDPYDLHPLPQHAHEPPESWARSGYISSVEWRFAAGGWGQGEPALVWTRPRVALVAGESADAMQRLLVVADSASGVSAVVHLRTWLFINPELTVHFTRPPEGEWICLDAASTIVPGGAAISRSTLSDAHGPVAYGAQSLLVRPR